MILAYVENMKILKTFVYWIHFILQLKDLLHFHVIIQSLNTNYLWQHYEDINHDHNL
jgi:hypothetical protein